jgi:hypothetical protein
MGDLATSKFIIKEESIHTVCDLHAYASCFVLPPPFWHKRLCIVKGEGQKASIKYSQGAQVLFSDVKIGWQQNKFNCYKKSHWVQMTKRQRTNLYPMQQSQDITLLLHFSPGLLNNHFKIVLSVNLDCLLILQMQNGI